MKKKPKWLRKHLRAEKKAKKNWNAYTVRNKALTEMGFATYQEYLGSDLWKQIRTKRLAISDQCSCCDKKADIVHHDTYYKKLLEGDDKSIQRDLYPLCNGCHYQVEFDGERKRSAGEAIKEFRRMLYRFENGMSKGQMIRNKIKAHKKRKNTKL